MTVVSSREFSQKPLHYLKLADTEEVAIKRGKRVYKITSEEPKYKNPVDPSDPFWDDPRNVKELYETLERYEAGEMEVVELTEEEEEYLFGNL